MNASLLCFSVGMFAAALFASGCGGDDAPPAGAGPAGAAGVGAAGGTGGTGATGSGGTWPGGSGGVSGAGNAPSGGAAGQAGAAGSGGNASKTIVLDTLKAFPTAYGRGALSEGGRNGVVVEVTNLDDNNSPGSFRYAMTRTYPRTIVFRVAGEIVLGSMLFVGQGSGKVTVAGQTAPGGGITVRGDRIYLERSDDVIMRHIRVRNGNLSKPPGSDDCITLAGAQKVIFDHVSISYGLDEMITAGGYSSGSGSSRVSDDVTIQNCLIGEGIEGHNTGSILGTSSGDYGETGNFSYHRNVIYNVTHRFPNVGGDENSYFEIVNNVVSNWSFRLSRFGGRPNIDLVNNYYDIGNIAKSNLESRLHKVSYTVPSHVPQIYIAGNLIMPAFQTSPTVDNRPNVQYFQTNALGTANTPVGSNFFKAAAVASYPEQPPLLTAQQAFAVLPTHVGASRGTDGNGDSVFNRDSLDADWMNRIQTGTTHSAYPTSTNWVYPAIASGPAYPDANSDGIPDGWVSKYDIVNTAGYTPLELYLAEIAGDFEQL